MQTPTRAHCTIHIHLDISLILHNTHAAWCEYLKVLNHKYKSFSRNIYKHSYTLSFWFWFWMKAQNWNNYYIKTFTSAIIWHSYDIYNYRRCKSCRDARHSYLYLTGSKAVKRTLYCSRFIFFFLITYHFFVIKNSLRLEQSVK